MKKLLLFLFLADLFSGVTLPGESTLSKNALSPKSILNFSKPRASTKEIYIRSFKNVETTDSTSHDFMYYWVKSKTQSGEWPKDIIVINFDFHPDDENDNSDLDVGNWGGHLKKEGLISEYWWLYPTESSAVFNTKATHDIDVQSASLYALKPTKKPVVITFDLDYLLSYSLQSSSLDMSYIEHQIEQITMALKTKKYTVLGINFTHSPDYITGDSSLKDEVLRKLGKELKSLFGEVRFGSRISSLSYNQTLLSLTKESQSPDYNGHLLLYFEYIGDQIIGILNKKSNLDESQRKNAMNYFSPLFQSEIKSLLISS